MATTYKRSGVQGTAAVTTYATLYQVPTSPATTQAVLSTIAICNTAGSSGSYRIGFTTSATDPAAADWLVYGGTVPANDTVFLTIGVSLAAGTFIRVSSSATTMTFQAFVSEIT
jgi:hypothetical protein